MMLKIIKSKLSGKKKLALPVLGAAALVPGVVVVVKILKKKKGRRLESSFSL